MGKNGLPPQDEFKMNNVENGRDALQVENGVYMAAGSRLSQPYGFNRADSYKIGSGTGQKGGEYEKDSDRTCCLIVIVFLLVAAILAGVAVALVFVFVSKLSMILKTFLDYVL